MTEYVAGFLFENEKVALVVKNHPAWQKGKMNGIGGHIEEGETPEQAMSREFVEETGHPDLIAWNQFAVLSGEHFAVHFFYGYGDLSKVQTVTDEKIVVVPADRVNEANAIPNLTWLIPMAKSMQYDSANLFKIQEG